MRNALPPALPDRPLEGATLSRTFRAKTGDHHDQPQRLAQSPPPRRPSTAGSAAAMHSTPRSTSTPSRAIPPGRPRQQRPSWPNKRKNPAAATHPPRAIRADFFRLPCGAGTSSVAAAAANLRKPRSCANRTAAAVWTATVAAPTVETCLSCRPHTRRTKREHRPAIHPKETYMNTPKVAPSTAHGHAVSDWSTEHWAASWGAAPAGPPLDAATVIYSNQTLRLIVHTSSGGSRVRVRLSNELGNADVRIGSAHVGLRAGATAAIVAGSDRVLTFSGATSVLLRAGTPVLSDPVDLAVPALSDLAISLYLPDQTKVSTFHYMATQNSYVSPLGNYTAAASLPVQNLIETWPFPTEVDVTGGSGAVIAIGDSVTDGLRSWGNYNYRWSDWLARRLVAAGAGYARLGVVNRGIANNSLLSNQQVGSLAGKRVIERFDRDVLATAGARYLIVLIGINDISFSTSSFPVTADDLIAGYRQLIARAHARGIAVFGATMPPFQGWDYYSDAKEQVRQAANNWIRNSQEFDAVLDFDSLLRDPSAPTRLIAAYDSGDHLHPNNAGYQLMGNSIPISLFVAIAGAGDGAPPSPSP